jgi:hypothetical protein
VHFRTQDAEGGRALFIDGGVYTRNRAFRLFLSSKAGKDAVLQPTGKPIIACPLLRAMWHHFSGIGCVQGVPQEPCLIFWQQARCGLLYDGDAESCHTGCADRFRGARLSHKDTFYSSLICNVDPGCRLLRCFDDAEGAAFSWAGWAIHHIDLNPSCLLKVKATHRACQLDCSLCPAPKMGNLVSQSCLIDCHRPTVAYVHAVLPQSGCIDGQVQGRGQSRHGDIH